VPENIKDLASLMADLDEERLLEVVKQRIKDKVNPMAILDKCREGIRIVGERFGKGEYFISDLIMSAEILKGVLTLLEPLMVSGSQGESAGKVVFGTVQGDIHNIGKDIVVSLLRADGYEVFDLGVDVPAEVFVNKVKGTGANIVGLSGLITVAYDGMKATIDALSKAGLRDRVKVMVGGSLMNDSVCAYVGADGWGNNAASAMTLARKFAKEV
jgi:methanogenic corrinoid protein MtbC1